MPNPTLNTVPDRLARPGLVITAGVLALSGAVLGALVHPTWALLAVPAGLALILTPDPAARPGSTSGWSP